MSIGPLTKKLLQKHRPVSYSKKRRKRALSPRSLTESSAESELSRLDARWDGLCGLVLITSSENCEKEGCETWSALPFWRSHCLDFFGGKSIWSYCRLSLNVSRISKTKPSPPLCVPSVWRAYTRPPRSYCILNLTQAVRTDPYAKMEMLAWTFDIYIKGYDRKLNVFRTEDAHACAPAPDRASLYTNALT